MQSLALRLSFPLTRVKYILMSWMYRQRTQTWQPWSGRYNTTWQPCLGKYNTTRPPWLGRYYTTWLVTSLYLPWLGTGLGKRS